MRPPQKTPSLFAVDLEGATDVVIKYVRIRDVDFISKGTCIWNKKHL